MMRILINPENTCYFEADGDEKNNIKISQTKTSDRHKIKSRKHSRNRQRKKRKHAEQISSSSIYIYMKFCVKQCLTFGFESAELSSPARSVRCGLGFDNGDSLRSKSQW